MPLYNSNTEIDLFDLNSNDRLFLHKSGRELYIQTENEYLATLGGETIWLKYSQLASNCNFVWSIAENTNYVFFATESPGRVFRLNPTTDEFVDLGQVSGEGSLRAIICANDDSIIVGSSSGKLYRSTNNGVSWTEVLNFGDNCQDSLFLANNGDLILGTDGNCNLYHSTNNGVNWSLNHTFPDTGVFSFIERNTDIYVGTNGKIYKSTDGGVSWSNVANTSAWLVYDFIIDNNNKLLFSGRPNAGIWKEGTDDSQWNQIFSSTTNDWAYCLEKKNNIIYTGTALNGTIYATPDNGSTWIDQGRLGTEKKVYSMKLLNNGTLIAGSGDQGWVFRLL